MSKKMMLQPFVSFLKLSLVCLVTSAILEPAQSYAQSAGSLSTPDATFKGVLQQSDAVPSQTNAPLKAQVNPEPESRPRRSYIGLGGAIGLAGDTTALGTGGLAILTKVGFTDNLSLHDATIIFGDRTATSMIALTGEFPIRGASGQTIISPFLGGGVMLRIADGLNISPLISGGVDVPLSRDLTGTVRANAGFPANRNADVGLLIGVGYNF
jgi:hypothetical protein